MSAKPAVESGVSASRAPRAQPVPTVAPAPRPGGRVLATTLAAVFVLGAWSLASLAHVGGRPLLAGPWETALALVQHGPTLSVDLAATFGRGALGLVLGAVAGLLLGLLVASLARVAAGVEAVLDVLRSVPPVVWLPIFLLGLGYGDVARVATIAAGVAVIIAVAVTTAARAPRSARQEVLALSGASWLQVLAWTQPWESLVALVVALRVSAAMAVIVATVTEMVAGAPHGIGARIVSAQVAGDTAQLTASVVAVGVAGWALGKALRSLQRLTKPWASHDEEARR